MDRCFQDQPWLSFAAAIELYSMVGPEGFEPPTKGL